MKFTWSCLLPVLLLISAGPLETTARDVNRKHGSRYRIGPRHHSVAQDEDTEASGRVISTGLINRFSSLKGGSQCSTASVTTTTTTTTTGTTTDTPTTSTTTSNTTTGSRAPPERVTYFIGLNGFDNENDEYDDYYYDDNNDDGLRTADNYQFGTSHPQSPVSIESSDRENENEDGSNDYVEAESADNDILTEERAAQDQPSSFAPKNQERQWNNRQRRRRVPANRRRRRNNPRRRRNNSRRRRNNPRRRRNNLRRRRPLRIRLHGQDNMRVVRRRIPIGNGGRRRVINLNK